MKLITATTLLLFFALGANAQADTVYKEAPTTYFNRFNTYVNNKNDADSAVYCLKALAALAASDVRYAGLLTMLVHDVFAQAFIPVTPADSVDAAEETRICERKVVAQRIMQLVLSDTNQVLYKLIHPVYMLAQAQEAEKDPVKLGKITETFIKEDLTEKQFYTNKTIRYGLVLRQMTMAQPTLQTLDAKLASIIYNHLQQNQVTVNDSSSRATQDKRAWYRYMFAATNYLAAANEQNAVAKQAYLKKAFEFSPDLMDQNHGAAYFYDDLFLFSEGKPSAFKDDYIKSIMKMGDPNEVKSLLLNLALTDPEFKPSLKEYYAAHNSGTVKFDKYWQDAINASGAVAPAIVLNKLDKTLFSNNKLPGKWIMVDFWGTWCAPCRREHPGLQKFYDSTVLKNQTKISLITIACLDNETAVRNYMKEKKFSFPVAMSDSKIEKNYVVQGYPSKILITPQGKYVTVPFGVDWVAFVKAYSNLN